MNRDFDLDDDDEDEDESLEKDFLAQKEARKKRIDFKSKRDARNEYGEKKLKFGGRRPRQNRFDYDPDYEEDDYEEYYD